MWAKAFVAGVALALAAVALETVAVTSDGTLVLLDKYARVWLASPAADGKGYTLASEPVAYLGPGRPLGFHISHGGSSHDGSSHSSEQIIICDSLKGLMSLDLTSKRMELLATEVSADSPLDPHRPITYANDLDIAADGTVYFTSSQDIPVGPNTKLGFYDTFWSYMLGLYSGAVEGRLLAYYPSNRTTHVIAQGFWFANGVALAPDESFVAVVETNRFHVMRHWLKGPQAGSTDVLVDRLPGFPDGISRSADGNFWVALPAPVIPLVKALKYKLARALLPWLPNSLKPKIPQWGAVVKLSPTGDVLNFLNDPDGRTVKDVSAVTEHNGRLFFGNVKSDFVSYVDLSDVGL